MNSKSLERWQIERLSKRVQQELVFLNKLEGRMQQKHFPSNDPLYESARNALVAVNNLSIELHRLLDRA
jgi:hypothetical protein